MKDDPEAWNKLESGTTIGRFGRPEEVAEVAEEVAEEISQVAATVDVLEETEQEDMEQVD